MQILMLRRQAHGSFASEAWLLAVDDQGEVLLILLFVVYRLDHVQLLDRALFDAVLLEEML